MIPVFRRAPTLSLLVAVAALPAVGCGGNDEDVERARQEGAREARLQERQKEQRRRQRELEKKLKDLEERQKNGSGGGSSGGTPAPPAGGSSGGKDCGGGLSVNSVTSCAFAENVRAAYRAAGGGTVTVDVYSPTTDKTYAMTCSGGSPHVCVGGNSARVEFP